MDRTQFFDKRLTYLFSCDLAFLEVKASPQRQFQHLSFFEDDHAADKSSAVYNVFDEKRAMGHESVSGHVSVLEGRVDIQPLQEFALLSGRAMIFTEESARISFTFEGTLRAPVDDSLWLESDRIVESKAFLSLRFETPSTKHAWLPQEQCLGFGRLAQRNQVSQRLNLDVYAASAGWPANG